MLHLIFIAFLISCLIVWMVGRKSSPLPPGPSGLPFIGSPHELPNEYPWLEYANWAKKYGAVFSFKVFGSPTIIINSSRAATELLEKRSTNYSDRPRMIMADELMGWAWSFIHMPYADRWRRHRKMFHQYFQPRNLSAYYLSQNTMTRNLLYQLSRTPEEFTSHIKHYVGSIAFKAAYGYEVQSENDFYIKLVEIAMEPLLLVVHGNYLVDFLPFFRYIPDWFPGAGFKKQAKDGAKKTRDLRDIPFNAVKRSMADGSAKQSFTSDNLEKVKADGVNSKEEEEIVRNCAGIIYLAGTDTTSSLLLAWILAMAHYPDVQKTAQAQIDKVVGNTRLPEFNDRSSLPYLEATLLEVLRWHSIVPLAAPHRAIKEDEYEGYKIPAGATVTLNTWAILHDEEVYPEPLKFKPERFLHNDQVSFEREPDPIFSFGYGRRICPGRHFAMNTAWLAIASILATYNISKAVDANGITIEPAVEFTDGLVSHPKPFKVQIMPRSSDTSKIWIDTKGQEYFGGIVNAADDSSYPDRPSKLGESLIS